MVWIWTENVDSILPGFLIRLVSRRQKACGAPMIKSHPIGGSGILRERNIAGGCPSKAALSWRLCGADSWEPDNE